MCRGLRGGRKYKQFKPYLGYCIPTEYNYSYAQILSLTNSSLSPPNPEVALSRPSGSLNKMLIPMNLGLGSNPDQRKPQTLDLKKPPPTLLVSYICLNRHIPGSAVCFFFGGGGLW